MILPPLLLASAYLTNWRAFRSDIRIILQLAIGAVLFTTLAVGWATHQVLSSLPLAACFALGAIVSPPDAVAAKAVIKGQPLPRRIVTLLEGESLVNDATGLVLYRFAVAAAVSGSFDGIQATGTFLLLVAGGVAFGIACGFAASSVIGKLVEAELSVTVSLLAAWGSYIGAERFHLSGVLSTVACGIVMGWRQHEIVTARTRIQSKAVWETVTFVLDSVVFILIGLSLRGVLHRIAAGHLVEISTQVLVVVFAVIASRFVWIVSTTYLVRALLPELRRRDPYPPIGVPILLSWAGMRGVVSLAAALALPEAFPGRDFILVATFAVILVTVLVQGSTLAPLISILRLDERPSHLRPTLSEREARLAISAAELEAVKSLSAEPDGTQRHPRLLEQYGYRLEAITRAAAQGDSPNPVRADHFGTVLAGISAGRRELLRLHRQGGIDDAVMHTLEAELDANEMLARYRRGDREF